jgi:uncharacterized lipoprotein YajG
MDQGMNMKKQKIKSFSGRLFIMASLFLLSACADPNYSGVPPSLTNVAPEAPPAQQLTP